MNLDLRAPDSTARSRPTSLGLVFLVVFVDLLGFAIVLPLLPRYAERFEVRNATIGLLMASFSAMQFLFAPLWGRLSDRVGRRPVLLAGLAGSVGFYALFGVASIVESLPLMFLSRIGAGICGATIATAQAYIADATGVHDRAKGMALIGAAFGAGFTFGPILGSIALPRAQVAPGQLEPLNALPGFLASGLSLIAFVLAFWKLPESLRAGVSATRHRWINLRALRAALSVPSVRALLALFFLSTFAIAQMEATLARLTDAVFHLNDRHNFYVFTYLGLSLVIMQGVVVRRLAPRVGEPRLILAGMVLMAAGLELLSVSTRYASLAGLIIVIPLTISGFSFVTPSVHALISRRSDPGRQGEILGVNQSAAAMARIIGPFLGNVLFGVGPRVVYDVSAVLLIPALLLAALSVHAGSDWQAGAGS